jgi:23S rRNA (adenine2503-C2)-methyltransferase
MDALQGLTPAAMVERFPELSLAEARRVTAAILRLGASALDAPLPQIRRGSMAALRERGHVPALTLRSARRSGFDGFEKYLFEGADGALIESVRIPLEQPRRFSLCVSSQVGCALACAFCATGRMGLRRNLEAWEIVDQVIQARARVPAGTRIHGVVFQGMGEPMANLDRVLAAIAAFSEPSGLAIDARAITVCTSGLPSGIRRLAEEAPRVRLGLSIASALPKVRRSLMPIEGAHPLAEVIAAAIEHAQKTRLAPMLAVTLLRGVNDSPEDAAALAALVLDFTARAGVRPRLTLIPYNSIGGESEGDAEPFERCDAAAEGAFREVLVAAGVFAHRRYSGGGEVGAACGQLAALG